MLVPYTCPHCGTKGTVSQTLIGKTIDCLQCGNEILIKKPTTGATDDPETLMVMDGDDLAVDNVRNAAAQVMNSGSNNVEEFDADDLAVESGAYRKVSKKAGSMDIQKVDSEVMEIDGDDLAIDTDEFDRRAITKAASKPEPKPKVVQPEPEYEIEDEDEEDIPMPLRKSKPASTTIKVMCPHCQSMISKQAKICQYCGRDITMVPVAGVSYSSVPQEDLQRKQQLQRKVIYKRKLSYLRIFGALALIASLFLPWFGNKSGLDFGLKHEFTKNSNTQDIKTNNAKTENKAATENKTVNKKSDQLTMIAKSIAVPAIFAVAALGLLILLLELTPKRTSFLLALLPLILTGLLVFVLKDQNWNAINIGFPTIVFGAILVLVPGSKVPVNE